MNEMYKKIETLCMSKGINMTQMCREADIPRGNLTDLKNGRTAELSTKNLAKIAIYFEVSIDYLLGNEKKPPEQSGGPSDDDIKVALFGGAGEVTDEMWEEAKGFVEFIKERERKKREEK